MSRVSYSQMSLWHNCPLQWKLRYVDKLTEQKSNIYLVFGSAMHTVLQEYLDCMYNRSVKIADTLDLPSRLQEEMVIEFQKAVKKYDSKPASKEEMQEFFQDGINIIDFFKKRRADYFSKKHWELVGCEIPVNVSLSESIKFIGYLDVVLYHPPTNRYKILDIKTSTMGWNKYQKKDKSKTAQLLLYKKYFAEQRGLDINGSVSVNKAVQSMTEFVAGSFDPQGNHIADQMATPSKKSCRYCEFKRTEHCAEGVG
jgi:RecB family exonuclease